MDATPDDAAVADLPGEPERICRCADIEQAAAEQAVIDEPRREVAEPRRAVAPLRATSGTPPARLRRAVTRAVPATELDGADLWRRRR
jgi:hypothetical protein